MLAEARAKAPGARIRIGRLEDFYDALMAENPDIPVVRGDMPDTWIHGYMSMPDAVKINKHLQRTIYQTEALNTLLGDWGVQTSDCSGHVDDAMEQSLLFDEHTFGLALSHGRQEGWKYGDDFMNYLNEMIPYVKSKGLNPRMWASIGGGGMVSDIPVDNDVTANYWAYSWADFDKMVKDGSKEGMGKEAVKPEGKAEEARASEAGIVEIDTLRKVNENLISTIEETLRIQQEGRQKRQAAEQELARLEDELRNKLMAARE